MNEQESIAYIEEWDVTEAAKVLKWYEDDKLLRPCDCDTIVAIETEDLKAENAKLRSLVRDMYAVMVEDASNCDVTYPEQFDDRMRELGIEVDDDN